MGKPKMADLIAITDEGAWEKYSAQYQVLILGALPALLEIAKALRLDHLECRQAGGCRRVLTLNALDWEGVDDD